MVTSGRDRSRDIGKRKNLQMRFGMHRGRLGEQNTIRERSGKIGREKDAIRERSGEILKGKKNTIRERSGEIGRENALRNASGEIGREKRCDSFGKERSGEGGREQMFDSGEIGSD